MKHIKYSAKFIITKRSFNPKDFSFTVPEYSNTNLSQENFKIAEYIF